MIDMEEAGKRSEGRSSERKGGPGSSDEMKKAPHEPTDKHAKRQQHGEGTAHCSFCSSCGGCSNMEIDRETWTRGPWSPFVSPEGSVSLCRWVFWPLSHEKVGDDSDQREVLWRSFLRCDI